MKPSRFIRLCGTAIAALCAVTAQADSTPQEGYAFGVSDTVVHSAPENQTQWLLEQQRQHAPATQSALSAPLYIHSQRRLADSFRIAIPDSFGEQTRGDD